MKKSKSKKEKNITLINIYTKIILFVFLLCKIVYAESYTSEGITLSEIANCGKNETFVAHVSGLGNDRLSLKCIDDQHAPVFSVRNSATGIGIPYFTINPYSSTIGASMIVIKAIAGMPNSPFLAFADSNYISPPMASPPLSETLGGSLNARTYHVAIVYKHGYTLTTISISNSYEVGAYYLLKVTIPKSPDPMIDHVVIYVGTSKDAMTLQDTIELTTDADATWTEPTSGLIEGDKPKETNNTGYVQTAFYLAQNNANLVFTAFPDQSTNLLEFRDSTGNLRTAINTKGEIIVNGISLFEQNKLLVDKVKQLENDIEILKIKKYRKQK